MLPDRVSNPGPDLRVRCPTDFTLRRYSCTEWATFEYSHSISSILRKPTNGVRIELHSSSIRMDRVIVLKSSCIQSMACFSQNRATLGW